MTVRNYPASDLVKRVVKVTLINEGLGMTAKDRDATEEMLKAQGATKKAGAVIKNKYNPDNPILKRFKSQRGRIANLHRSLTGPWDDSGGRIITSKKYGPYKEKMDEEIAIAMNIVEEIVKNRDALVEDARGVAFNLGKMFNEADYPTADEIRDAYRIEIITEVLPDMTHPHLDMDNDRVEKIKHEAGLRVQQQCQKVTEHAMTITAKELTEMVNALERFGEKSPGETRAKTFRDTLVPRMRKLAETLPNLNIMEDPKLDKLAQDLAAKLCIADSKELRKDEERREEVLTEAKGVLDNLNDYFGGPN